MTCNYKSPKGHECKDADVREGKCSLHLPRSGDDTDEEKSKAIEERIKSRRDLVGVIFPKGYDLSSTEISSDIDMSFADFDDANVEDVVFKGNFKALSITSQTNFTLSRCTFEKEANFSSSSFHGEFQSLSTFNGKSDFTKCGFFGRTTISGMFNKDVFFNGSTFADATLFRGGRDVSARSEPLSIATEVNAVTAILGSASVISLNAMLVLVKEFFSKCKTKTRKFLRRVIKQYMVKKKELRRYLYHKFDLLLFNIFGRHKSKDVKIKRVFKEQCSLANVDFQRPERVSFVFVDLSRALLIGTNFVGVQFSDVNWYQPELKRKGIYEDSILNKDDISAYSHALPRNEEAYRNIRIALESNKDYDTASDFYIGERDSHRKQFSFLKRHLFSIDAWYNALSRYGTSPTRALRMIILFTVLYVSIRAYLDDVTLNELLHNLPSYTQRILKLFSLQKLDDSSTSSVVWLDTTYRFIIPIMLALTALSFRSRIKRH